MRPLLIAVATCLASTVARAQTSSSAPVCPSRDSIRPGRSSTSAAPDASGRVPVHLGESIGDYRYLTYVVDSQLVVLSDRFAPDSAKVGVLRDLSPNDIVSITVLKEASVPRSWRACEGVPVVLILTKSGRWRPRGPDARKSGE